MREPTQLLRSLLFVPALSERYIEKAHTRGADAIILDLEDSVVSNRKIEARKTVADTIALLAGRGVSQIFVRINSDIVNAIRDLEAAVSVGLSGVVLPKCGSAEHVRIIAQALSTLEQERGLAPGSIRLGVRVETPSAFFQIEEIAAAHERISFFGLGGEDFSFELAAEPTIEVLRYPKQQAIIAARAAGVMPIGLLGSGSDFSNPEDIRQNALMSRRFGFEGATCIYPSLVPILNEAFTPTDAEVQWARELVEVYDRAVVEGLGAISFRGRMVDAPVAARAKRIVSIAAAISDGEASYGRGDVSNSV